MLVSTQPRRGRKQEEEKRRRSRRNKSGLVSLITGLKEGQSEFIPLKSQTQQSQLTNTNLHTDVTATSSGVSNHR